MKYCSTRGQVNDLSFSQAVMMGLASDGGLLLPQDIPKFTPQELHDLGHLPYVDLAYEIISKFATDLPDEELRKLIRLSYTTFDHPDITPVIKRGDVYLLELFHGPTLAFKDVALQFLGNLFEYYLCRDNKKLNIVGATSGDTGSAAIAAVRGKKNINIFILYPYGRVSAVQEMQMTTVADDNVFNIAIDGTFDDAQAIVKDLFNDQEFKQEHALGAINSINWVRVLAQIVYYFYACFQVQHQSGAKEVQFCVPTGNFGDIFAGYIARKMGLPTRQLILATNVNNILSRFVNEGDYSLAQVHQSLSPSMDIQIASNFERYLYYLYDCNSLKVTEAMTAFKSKGKISFSDPLRQQIQADFMAATIDDQRTLEQIRSFYLKTEYILDPHTAVGVAAGHLVGSDVPRICLATAHPAKFPDAISQAVGAVSPTVPAIEALRNKPQKKIRMPADLTKIREFVADNAQ